MTFTRTMHGGERTITVRVHTPELVLYDWEHKSHDSFPNSKGTSCAMTPAGFKQRFNVKL